jgi:glycerophosphoryl diester phosphodiesterase
VHPEKRLATTERLASWHALGLATVPWTVDTSELWERAASAGVLAVITDHPGRLARWRG